MPKKRKKYKGALNHWQKGKAKGTSSIMGDLPVPSRTGPSPSRVLSSGSASMLSAGMPGNEENDPPRKLR